MTTLLVHPSISSVSSFSRRPVKTPDSSSRLKSIIESDTQKWSADLSTITPKPAIFFSGLGTTRAEAGGLENQRKIDLDLNLELAKAAKAAGVRVYVLISADGVSSTAMVPYSKMKYELEEGVKKLGFEKTVFIKPGLIVGGREKTRLGENAAQKVATFMGGISGGYLKNFWAQDADVIGKAAVSAGLKCLDGSAPGGDVWNVRGSDIIRLGSTEWKL